MKKFALLLCFVLILAASTYAADVEYTFIDASCDKEGRGVFYFIIEYDEPFSSKEALIRGFPGDWYDCVEAHCSYDYYDQPPGTDPKVTINSGREYMLITPPMTLIDSRTYDLTFIYPTEVRRGEAYEHNTIDIKLDCPGHDFSCSLYDFELDDCVSGDGKFRMEVTAKGIDQPHSIDLIDDFRYGIVGEKTQIIDTQPLTDASIKYKRDASVSPDKAEVISLGNDRYAIEFPYGDKASWLTVKGKYCRHDDGRFGKSSNYEFLATKRCTVREFIVKTVEDEPAEEPEASAPTKYYAVPDPVPSTQKEAPKEPAKAAEPETPKQEITFFSLLKAFFGLFKR
ncbi:hypothetical protein KY360_04795 [Candidatus Woesearchaeota archaeon]|nr:hypothetical protein [Candidatus Woesearchaeota archaeon]